MRSPRSRSGYASRVLCRRGRGAGYEGERMRHSRGVGAGFSERPAQNLERHYFPPLSPTLFLLVVTAKTNHGGVWLAAASFFGTSPSARLLDARTRKEKKEEKEDRTVSSGSNRREDVPTGRPTPARINNGEEEKIQPRVRPPGRRLQRLPPTRDRDAPWGIHPPARMMPSR